MQVSVNSIWLLDFCPLFCSAIRNRWLLMITMSELTEVDGLLPGWQSF